MQRVRNPLVIVLVAVAAVSCSSQEEQVDLKPFTDAATAHFAANGVTLTIGEAKPEGNDIVLTGVTVAANGSPPAKIGEIRFQDVKEDETTYRITAARAPQFSVVVEEQTLEFGGVELRGLTIPKDKTDDPMDRALLLESARFQGVRGLDDGDEVFRVESARYEATPYQQGKPMKYTMEIHGIEADPTRLPDQEAREMMAALGYDAIKASVSGSGSWDPQGGRVVMDNLAYRIEDAALLEISLDVTGLTPQFIAAMQELSNQAERGTSNQLAGLAYMGLMQQLVFSRFDIRLRDASLTNRIIDYRAKQEGISRDDVISQAKATVQAALLQLRNPSFAQNVRDAVGEYLDDPKSLTVAAEPPQPVDAPTVMMTGMAAPQRLPEVLGVTVTANGEE